MGKENDITKTWLPDITEGALLTLKVMFTMAGRCAQYQGPGDSA